MHSDGTRGHSYLETMAAGADERPARLDAVPDDLGEIDFLALQDDLSPHDPGNIQKIVHEARQMARLAIDHRARPVELRVAGRMQAQDLHGAADRRQRIAQLVSEHREELILALVHFLQCFLDGTVRARLFECRPYDVADALDELDFEVAPIAWTGVHHRQQRHERSALQERR